MTLGSTTTLVPSPPIARSLEGLLLTDLRRGTVAMRALHYEAVSEVRITRSEEGILPEVAARGVSDRPRERGRVRRIDDPIHLTTGAVGVLEGRRAETHTNRISADVADAHADLCDRRRADAVALRVPVRRRSGIRHSAGILELPCVHGDTRIECAGVGQGGSVQSRGIHGLGGVERRARVGKHRAGVEGLPRIDHRGRVEIGGHGVVRGRSIHLHRGSAAVDGRGHASVDRS